MMLPSYIMSPSISPFPPSTPIPYAVYIVCGQIVCGLDGTTLTRPPAFTVYTPLPLSHVKSERKHYHYHYYYLVYNPHPFLTATAGRSFVHDQRHGHDKILIFLLTYCLVFVINYYSYRKLCDVHILVLAI